MTIYRYWSGIYHFFDSFGDCGKRSGIGMVFFLDTFGFTLFEPAQSGKWRKGGSRCLARIVFGAALVPIDVLPGRAVGSRMCSPPSQASWRGRHLQQRQRSSEDTGVEPPTVRDRLGEGAHPRARSWASFIYTIT